MKHQLFFELLKTVIGQRKVLSAVPSAKEWEAIYGSFFLSRSIFLKNVRPLVHEFIPPMQGLLPTVH